ncbi:MAG TPA: FecR domain-containing protein [Verrucomicrobiae bacterium]|nr:FecR domain-containing protein [Verrucomicrobiae bacterium]
MKLASKTLIGLLAGVLSLALVASAEAQTSKQRTGKVVRIKGAARYSTGNNVWQPLKVGSILKAGYIVQTAQDSYTDIVLNEEASVPAAPAGIPSKAPAASSSSSSASPSSAAARSVDQDVVRVLPDTVLSFDRLTAVETGGDRVTETELDLRTGAIFGAVKKQAAASRFEIKIPNGVAGIRGTYFYASSKGMFSCLSGSMVAAYTNADGTPGTQVVAGGNQFNTATRELAPIGASLLTQLNILVDDVSALTQRQAATGAGRVPNDEAYIDQTVYPVSRSGP